MKVIREDNRNRQIPFSDIPVGSYFLWGDLGIVYLKLHNGLRKNCYDVEAELEGAASDNDPCTPLKCELVVKV